MKPVTLKDNGRLPVADLDSTSTSTASPETEAPPAAQQRTPLKKKGKIITTPQTIVRLEKAYAQVKVVGDVPLIVNNFSEKAKQQIRDKQQKLASQGREKKDPVVDFQGSLYRMVDPDEGFGFPARAFKAAMVVAGNDVDQVKTQLKRMLRVSPINGDPYDVDALVKIHATPITTAVTQFDKLYADRIAYEHKHGASMREDAVRLAQGQADLRYRAQFFNWHCTFEILFNARALSPEQLLALLDAAGMCGIGEWRPSAPENESGQFGCFHVDSKFTANG